MVRIKHRYLLFDILYPPTSDSKITPRDEFSTFSKSELNALIQLHQTSPAKINPRTILSTIRKALQDNYGDTGSGKAGGNLIVKYFSNKTSTGILRCDREQSDLIVAALSLITKIELNFVIFRCLHVSGTIKKCEEYSIDKTRQLINVIKNNKGKVEDYMLEMNEIKQVEDDINFDGEEKGGLPIDENQEDSS